MNVYFITIILIIIIIGIWFYHHQCVLRNRAMLMREAIRNKEFTFKLPVDGLFFGEQALQEALNDIGQDVNKLVAQNEVESWQRLTRVLTHEIMNATTPIQSISQAYLSSPKIKGTVYEEGIRAIHDTSTSLASFVDSYRKLTALQEPVLADIKLAEFITTVCALYNNVIFKIDIAADITLHADVNLLRQVVINIVKNAIEAGAMNISISWNGNLLVSNDGSPIPADIQRDIFIPFFTTKHTGSGIGLSLSRQILMMQGMNLLLASKPVSGYHTTFIIVAK